MEIADGSSPVVALKIVSLHVSCRHTGYVNDFDEAMNFEASEGEVITGVFNYNSDKYS
jgi:hypothetical protein